MGKVLQDLWILSDSGVVVFNRVFDDKMDAQLFGALMSALNSFAEELSKGGLSNFDLSDKRFTIIKEKNFLFVANSSKKMKPKKVEEELFRIVDIYFSTYSDEILNNWEGDVSIFQDFASKIDESLEDTVKKFQESFW